MKFKMLLITTTLLGVVGISPALATNDAPTNVTASVNGTDITLNFAGIAGNSYISVCRQYVGSAKSTLSPYKVSGTSPIVYRNMKAKSTYRCYIANNYLATKNYDNVQGDGLELAWNWTQAYPIGYISGGNDLITTSTASTAPTNVRVVPASSSIVILFGYPTGAQSVNASCLNKSGGATLTQSSDSSPIVLMGANPGSTYSCSLSAVYLNSTPSASVVGNDVSLPTSTSGVPFSPAIDKVLLKGSNLEVTVLPPLNGSAVNTFTATCVNSVTNKIYTSSSSTNKITVPVDSIGSFSCTASSSGPYGRSQESSKVDSTKAKIIGGISSLTYKLGSISSTGSLVTFTAPLDLNVVSVKFACLGQSTSNYGKEVWALAVPVNNQNPTTKLDLTFGNWSCGYQNTSTQGLSPESPKINVAVELSAPNIKVGKNRVTINRPSGWIGTWSGLCTGSDSTQVVKGSISESVTLYLSKGNWRCSASQKGTLTASKIVKL